MSFRYDPDQPLIEDLSLTVTPGQTVAIVGPTGAGKTTLVNLLMRFYELTAGQILLDGIDIAAMSRDELRGRSGMVLQDAWLFCGTIAENIAYGSPGAPASRSSRRPRPPTWTASCAPCPTATTRCWTTRASVEPGSGSSSPSPGPSWPTRRS